MKKLLFALGIFFSSIVFASEDGFDTSIHNLLDRWRTKLDNKFPDAQHNADNELTPQDQLTESTEEEK